MEKTDRPFHETVVDAIKDCDQSLSNGHILLLMQVIASTDIPRNHAEIMRAVDEYFNFPGGEKWADHVDVVKKHLLGSLNTNVTVAINAMQEKALVVSKLEETLTYFHPVNSSEWRIACRGAVMTALAANDGKRALFLVDQFASRGADQDLMVELRGALSINS